MREVAVKRSTTETVSLLVGRRVVMKNKFFTSAVLAMSFVLSGCLWAQKAVSTNAKASAVDAAPVVRTTNLTAYESHNANFVIGIGDVLSISVWKEPDISHSVPVRSDGKISLPLIGEVEATGTTPLQLEHAIAAKLKSYIAEPHVTVMVEQIKSKKFTILGQVTKPGTYSLTDADTVLDAIALAGGCRDFARQKSIYLLRQQPDGTQARIAFNYKDVVNGKHPEQNIRLKPTDIVVVP